MFAWVFFAFWGLNVVATFAFRRPTQPFPSPPSYHRALAFRRSQNHHQPRALVQPVRLAMVGSLGIGIEGKAM